jgi:hypothetical protein
MIGGSPITDGPTNMMIRNTRLALVILSCLLLLTVAARGQSPTTGQINGTVRDERGEAIAGAEVTVSSIENAAVRAAVSDGQGNFSISLLAPGAYRVRISAAAFTAAEFADVRVAITETTIRDAILTVAATDFGIVTVGPPTQRDGPSLGRVVDSRNLTELPLATRNFLQILALSPGTSVALPDNTALGRNSQNISVNGARVTQNDFEINGVDANNITNNAAAGVAVPAPESIQEFKVQTSLYAAPFGRSGGGNVQAITRGGGNEFHGAVYEYFRNDALNANNPFLKAAGVDRPVLSRNVFGGTVGGPIQADRLFFFVSYQGTRERNGASPNSLTSSVLIAPGLTNDRSQATLIAIFHPQSPGNPPATSINPVALALLNTRLPSGQFVIPTPLPDGHYSGSAISTYREDQFNANVDWRLGANDWLTGRTFFSNGPLFFALPSGGANVPGFGADQQQRNALVSVQENHVFGPNLINEVRVGYSFIRGDAIGQNPIRDTDLGITRANAQQFPGLGVIRIGPNGTNGIAFGNAGNNVDTQATVRSTTVADILSSVRGRHTVRIGLQANFYGNDLAANNNRRGQITFQSFNNFLLGSASASVYGDGIATRFLRAADYGLFVQDDWRVSSKLTLNLGLRYDLDLPPTETRGALSTFDPALYQPRMQVDGAGNPVGPPIGGFVQAGNVIPEFDLPNVPNVSKRLLTSVDPDNFGPRLGFAYAPFDSGKLVVRGGYGIFYSRTSNAYVGTSINAPPLYTVRRSPAGGTVQFANPYFPVPAQSQFPAFVTGVALTGQIFDRNLCAAYFHQFNTSIQYSPGHDLLFEVAYVGGRGRNLIRDLAINQARLASPQNPIFNAVTGLPITTNTPAAANVALRAPFQGVEVGSFLQIQSTGRSNYNSLQLSLTKRLARGLQFLASYTFGRSIDNASGGSDSMGEAKDTINVAGNQLDPAANRGLSDFDRTHRFVLSYLWDLPEPSFARTSRVGKLFFSRWQIAGIITGMSGLPIDIIDGGSGSFFGLSGGNNALVRPSWAPNATTGTATSNIPAGYFFNPFAFVRPVVLNGQIIPSSNGAARANATGTDIGNVGRNALRGPNQSNIDISMIKRFSISESRDIEVRAEFFNLLNRVNFANPVTNLSAVPATSIDANTGRITGTPGDFGRIVATSNNPRLVQLAIKLNF